MGKTQTEANYVLLAVNGRLSQRPGVALKAQRFIRRLSLSATATEQRGYKYLSGGGAMGRLGVPRLTKMLDKPLGPSPVRLPKNEAG